MSPFTPFITEEIYQTHFKKYEKNKSVHLESWPTQYKVKTNKEDQKIWDKLLEKIKDDRQKKSEAKKSMKAQIKRKMPEQDYHLLKKVMDDYKATSGAITVEIGPDSIEFVES